MEKILLLKALQINSVCNTGSTGKVCIGISNTLSDAKIENYILSSFKSNLPSAINCGYGKWYSLLQTAKAHTFGNYGFNSKLETRKIICELEHLKPDVVHLHNIHSHDCNVEILFSYLRESKISVIWTFHDCWAFTAYCPHFTMAKCDKWKNGCNNCPQFHEYSFFFDRSRELFEKKRAVLQGLNMTIVTPSQWLAELVKQSFLKDYSVKVINNGIDLSIFKPTASNFRENYGIPNDKFIILGVAFGWGIKKGLDVFVKLSEHLDDLKYQIVLVGTDDKVDTQLPDNIISIHRTHNQRELAEIYSAADVLVNASREENLPTVNIEALACGTPVITFRTGGSPEIIDETCGSVVGVDDIDGLENEIVRVCEETPFSSANCVKRAQLFDQNIKYQEYVDLYRRVYDAASES